ncbi:MAG: type II toxin-antitoxin system VapC family toxin [Saprospiraceae bacterium]
MENYLLDSDICIFFLRGAYGLKEKILQVGIENCYVSEITIAELSFGAAKSANYDKHILEVEGVEQLFGVVPIYECIRLFAAEKVYLNKLGQTIPDFDLLIGVTAVKYNMVLVTNNEKHLRRIRGIKIENWLRG